MDEFPCDYVEGKDRYYSGLRAENGDKYMCEGEIIFRCMRKRNFNVCKKSLNSQPLQ